MGASILEDARLRPYLDDVRVWHGYMRHLGLPTIQDHPDTPLTDLFVAPALADRPVAPESNPRDWPEGKDILTLLSERRRLIVLGDPGSGKSTLVNWLAWLSAGGASGVLPEAMHDLLPLPMLARELRLRGVNTFAQLVDAFLARPVAAQLRDKRDAIFERLEQGRALILIDGIDEVSIDDRQSLREAVLDGWQRYRNLYWVATSRIVGYDECALEFPIEAFKTPDVSLGFLLREKLDSAQRTVYVMPFNPPRIAAFAQHWYRLRSLRPLADQDAASFLHAMQRDDTVQTLARTPQLLTLMALVFRVRAQLPDGRALLYDMITEAYLESIDRARHLGAEDRYPWREKRRWLARIGFEMQLLRGRTEGDEREMLASREQVVEWVRQAMHNSGYPADAVFAHEYLEWVARRSGLLLPRGEGLFAFVHLSFQEYFTALHLVEHLSDADWVVAQREGKVYPDGDKRVDAQAIADWARDQRWQEVMVFAFECFAHQPKEARRLSMWIFGEGLSELQAPTAAVVRADKTVASDPPRSELLARIVTNPHSGLTPSDREKGLQVALDYIQYAEGILVWRQPKDAYRPALRRLIGNVESRATLWRRLAGLRPKLLDLRGSGEIVLAELPEMRELNSLFVDGIGDSDLSALQRLPALRNLDLGSAPALTSLDGVLSSPGLLFLFGSPAPQVNLDALAALKEIEVLGLWGSPIERVDALAGLHKLLRLYLTPTATMDLGPLRQCRALEEVSLFGKVSSIVPLAHLPALKRLSLPKSIRLPKVLREREVDGKLKVERF